MKKISDNYIKLLDYFPENTNQMIWDKDKFALMKKAAMMKLLKIKSRSSERINVE